MQNSFILKEAHWYNRQNVSSITGYKQKKEGINLKFYLQYAK